MDKERIDGFRILRVGAGYFRIVAFSYLPMAVSTVLSAWLRCKEHAAVPFWASFGAVAANTGRTICSSSESWVPPLWALPVLPSPRWFPSF